MWEKRVINAYQGRFGIDFNSRYNADIIAVSCQQHCAVSSLPPSVRLPCAAILCMKFTTRLRKARLMATSRPVRSEVGLEGRCKPAGAYSCRLYCTCQMYRFVMRKKKYKYVS